MSDHTAHWQVVGIRKDGTQTVLWSRESTTYAVAHNALQKAAGHAVLTGTFDEVRLNHTVKEMQR